MTRTYVVTGSASGIGAAATQTLRDRGDRVIGIDLRGAEVDADLSVHEGRVAAAAQAVELSGGVIDGVLAVAGIGPGTPGIMAVNYFGVTELLDALQPALAASSAPRAAVVSSMASLQPSPKDMVEAALSGDEARTLGLVADFLANEPEGEGTVYSASKRAVARWVRRESITQNWAGAGIALNAVAPGIVITPLTEALLSTEEGTAALDASAPMPLNYHQPAQSIADLLVWLTDEQNTHTTGQVIYCDGGADASVRGDDIWSWND